MTFRLLLTLIAQNFKNQRHIIIPFILIMSVLFGIEYILLTLNMNAAIRQHNDAIPAFIGIGNVFMSLLGILFILYANRFIMRRRQKELAMNMILGMEKKHFRFVMLIEMMYQYIMIAFVSIVGGHLFGALTYMFLNKVLGHTHISIKTYPFNMHAMNYTLLMLALMMIFLFILNNIKITFQSPIKLIQQQHPTEKQWPKPLLYILLIIGIISILGSYTIALKATLILISLRNIFITIFLVTIGTYCLFTSLGILTLDWLQKIPSVYYKPKYFFTISGLRSRMNSNAIGLASLTMLCTFLIVTLGMSVSTYRGVGQRIDHLLPTQYRIEFGGNENYNTTLQHHIHQIKDEIKTHTNVDDFKEYVVGLIPVDYHNQALNYRNNKDNALNLNSVYLIVMTQKDYNELNGTHVHLEQNEVGVLTNSLIFKHLNHIKLMNERFKVNHLAGSNFSYPVPGGITIIADNEKQQRQFIDYYLKSDHKIAKDNEYFNTFLAFNQTSKNKHYIDSIENKLTQKYEAQLDSKDQMNKSLLDIYGGLIFIGTIVSLVLMIGAFTMMYYKNVAEGYEDRQNYQIMRKVGLEEARIKSTINHQIIIVFTLPIVVALIHVLFASKIIFNLLGILEVNQIGNFVTSYIGVIIVVMIFYALMYWLTSQIYYRIINRYL